MPYQSKHLRIFVDRVISEANKAAQDIFDKYQKEFYTRLDRQIPIGARLDCGMGSASIDSISGESIDNDLVALLVELQYPYRGLDASFSTPDIDKRIK